MRRMFVAVIVPVALILCACGLNACNAAAPAPGSMHPDSASVVSHSTLTTEKKSAAIPKRVWQTLAKIDSGTWPESAHAPGTRGGQKWQNREKRLPSEVNSKHIVYREWDVNPKISGHSRDAERIITGSDGSAWYTADHYRTFTRIR